MITIKHRRTCFLFMGIFTLLLAQCHTNSKPTITSKNPNVLLIMVDDLNDNIGVLAGHPQSITPNMNKLAKSGVLFTNAHCNAPMCGPSRASMFTGVYPHHSNNYFQSPWYNFEVLNNTRTMMEQFLMKGYQVLGTGKILHHNQPYLWTHFENPADYTPTPLAGSERLPHPDVPIPFSDIGWVDGSLGPFINLEDRKTADGRSLAWTTGSPNTGFVPMRYIHDEDRDLTPDEKNASWAAKTLDSLSKRNTEKPFFLGVGFLRPHTPLVAPQKYFDLFPLDSIVLSAIKINDQKDTYLRIAYQGDLFTLSMGQKMFESISEAYGSTDVGLKKWTQAYLACVAAVDENIGEVMDVLDATGLKENTIVILASDHGFHMGEKEYLYKNSLWEESTRVPLMIRVPGLTRAETQISNTVSLIDVYPTLIELCQLDTLTKKNENGHQPDGRSLVGILSGDLESLKEKDPALTVVYAGTEFENDPTRQHYALRSDQYRYIMYNNGMEELYDHVSDPNEWENIASINKEVLNLMRDKLKKRVYPIQLNGFTKLKI